MHWPVPCMDPEGGQEVRWGADDGPTLNAGLVALRISGDPVQYC